VFLHKSFDPPRIPFCVTTFSHNQRRNRTYPAAPFSDPSRQMSTQARTPKQHPNKAAPELEPKKMQSAVGVHAGRVTLRGRGAGGAFGLKGGDLLIWLFTWRLRVVLHWTWGWGDGAWRGRVWVLAGERREGITGAEGRVSGWLL